jgi:RNA-binding protein
MNIPVKVYRGRTDVSEILFQVGVFLHQARSGRLIFRLSRELKPGSVLVDGKGKKIGKVVELIGPVKAPYASVVPATSRVGKAGEAVFVTG